MPVTSWFGGLSFLLQAALVVVAVIIFSFIDPFGLLVGTKLKLKDTPISVESMKEIGELITAEYYGEVISSTMEDVEIRTTSLADEFQEDLDSLHQVFFEAIDQMDLAADQDRFNRERRAQARAYFEDNFGALKAEQWFAQYIQAARTYLANTRSAFDPKASNTNVQFGNLLKALLTSDASYAKLRQAAFRTGMVSSFKNQLTEVKEKEYRKKQLVLLGRGSVKAGFRFHDFSEKNFRYEKESNRVVFIGIQPEILSQTINPWFIPEKGVEGFEFLIIQRKAKRDPNILLRVKRRCLEELVAKAHQADILEEATKNAQEQLKNFFDLLLDEPVTAVSFYNNVFDYTEEAVKKDGIISGAEFYMIDRAIAQANQLIEDNLVTKERVDAFMTTIRGMKYRLFDQEKPDGLSPFVSFVYIIGKDGKLEYTDEGKIEARSPSRFDETSAPGNWQWWYGEGNYLSQANEDYEIDKRELKHYVSAIELENQTLTKVDLEKANADQANQVSADVNDAFDNALDQIIPTDSNH